MASTVKNLGSSCLPANFPSKDSLDIVSKFLTLKERYIILNTVTRIFHNQVGSKKIVDAEKKKILAAFPTEFIKAVGGQEGFFSMPILRYSCTEATLDQSEMMRFFLEKMNTLKVSLARGQCHNRSYLLLRLKDLKQKEEQGTDLRLEAWSRNESTPDRINQLVYFQVSDKTKSILQIPYSCPSTTEICENYLERLINKQPCGSVKIGGELGLRTTEVKIFYLGCTRTKSSVSLA